MKKVRLFLLVVLPVYFFISLYFLDKNYFLCPIEYKADILIRSDSRGDGFFAAERRGNRKHQGLDLWAPQGTAVLAARSGRVVMAKEKNNGIGICIILSHPGNLLTIYGHLSKIYVAQSQFVRQGEVIAEVGKTGNANYPNIQPHLHFEVRKDNIAQDPMRYLE